jgi:hypothetical protein
METSIWFSYEWLWKCDLVGPISAHCIMNQMHLLEMLIARYRALKKPALQGVCLNIQGIVNQQIDVATLIFLQRRVKGIVDCVQMHW